MKGTTRDVVELFAEGARLGDRWQVPLWLGGGFNVLTRKGGTGRRRVIAPAPVVPDPSLDGIEELIAAVAGRHGVTPKALLGRSRRLAPARRDLYEELQRLGWSLPRIGRLCGRHHTSILVALRQPARAVLSVEQERILVEATAAVICARHDILPDQLLAYDKRRRFVRARADFCVELKRQGLHVAAISRAIGRDRSSVTEALVKAAA